MTFNPDGSVESALLAITSDPQRVHGLLEGSSVFGASYQDWEATRRPMAAIDQPGTLLDIGCANGFLLLCLLAWSPYAILPFGIDVDADRLEQARELLPPFASHFVQLGLGELNPRALADTGLPEHFDFVAWNVWDDLDFQADWHWDYLDRALGVVRPGGRLVLGFYDHDPAQIEAKLVRLVKRLGPPVGRVGPVGHGVVFAWWTVNGWVPPPASES